MDCLACTCSNAFFFSIWTSIRWHDHPLRKESIFILSPIRFGSFVLVSVIFLIVSTTSPWTVRRIRNLLLLDNYSLLLHLSPLLHVDFLCMYTVSLPGKARVIFFFVLIFPVIPFVPSRPLNGVEPIARTPVHAIWVSVMRELLCHPLHILLAPISLAAEVATAQILHDHSLSVLLQHQKFEVLDNASSMFFS